MLEVPKIYVWTYLEIFIWPHKDSDVGATVSIPSLFYLFYFKFFKLDDHEWNYRVIYDWVLGVQCSYTNPFQSVHFSPLKFQVFLPPPSLPLLVLLFFVHFYIMY